ncbi:hypothetical protein B566_EDAN010063 [Ephemera danica]|nr:hypothetical protein B566_EDAN010063 [Ephemera danica]
MVVCVRRQNFAVVGLRVPSIFLDIVEFESTYQRFIAEYRRGCGKTTMCRDLDDGLQYAASQDQVLDYPPSRDLEGLMPSRGSIQMSPEGR